MACASVFPLRCRLLVWAAALVLLGCGTSLPSGEQPVREQTRLDITISTAEDVNPDDQGRAAPIVVRVYELRSTTPFENADYFSLEKEDKKTLGEDMLVRDEFIMRPGDRQVIRRESNPAMRAIAVLAGYRDLPHANWRAVQKAAATPESAWYRAVVPNKKLKLDVQLQARAVQISPVP